MDWIKIVYSIVLLICGIAIFIAFYFQRGDERKEFIHRKAQSFVFIVVFGMLLLEVAESLYFTIQGNTSYNGYWISPIMFLTVILIIYLGTLLTYRKKYGD